MNLWLGDTPFLYKASRGRSVSFHHYYKNAQDSLEAADNGQTNIFTVGSHCHTPWRSYLQAIPGESTNFWLYLGDGAVRKVTVNQMDYQTHITLVQQSSTNLLAFANGAQKTYGYSNLVNGVACYFLTRDDDANGNGLQFQYGVTNGAICLAKILDVDNKAISFEYSPAGNYLSALTKVISPHGHTNLLRYDGSGRLTNIVDVIGLASFLQYDTANLTSLVTPYGTNNFTHFTNASQMRAIYVNEQNIRKHLFLYHPEVDGGKVPSSYAGYRPSTTNGSSFAIANTFDSENSHQRNSFHWNPRQMERVTAGVRTALDSGSFNVTNLTASDYLVARQKHWLKDATGTNASFTLSLYREGSPDGTAQGQIKWFDYAGKPAGTPDREGTMSRPRFVAWRLPNGEPRFFFSERNPLGHTTNQAETYSATGGACQVRTNQFIYAANNIDLIRQIQVMGATTKQVSSNSFNSAHQVLTRTDALGQTTTYAYNANRQMVSVRTPAGLTRTNVYETTGTWSNFLTKSIALEAQQTNSFSYSNGLISAKTDPRGLTKTYVHDGFGRLLRKGFPDGTAETRTYDKLDVVAVADRLNHTNGYAYNGFRQKIRSTNPLGATNTYGYCDCGPLESATDASGKTTWFSYDLRGRLIVKSIPGGGSVTNHYDLMGRVTNVVDAAGNSVTNFYNNQGLVCATTNAFGRVQAIEFDIEDRATNRVDANAVTNQFIHDDLGRVVRRIDAAGNSEFFAYTTNGLVAQTNQLGQYTLNGYDIAGRKIAETNANGEFILYTYSSAGDLIKLRDGKGQETSWGYDQYGRMTSKTNAAGTEIFRYQYDANGRLTSRWSLAKGSTGYSYDAAGNLTGIDYPSSPDVTMQYDANNRLLSMTDAAGTTAFGYTDFGALLSEDGPWPNDTLTYGFTTNRLRSKLTLLQPSADAWAQSYGYDSADRLTGICSPAGQFGYAYGPGTNTLVSTLWLPNACYIGTTYDTSGRLLGTYLRRATDQTTINSHQYQYDAANRRTRQTRTDGSYADYTYDSIGQLKTTTGKEPGGTTNRMHEQQGYTYDAAGNLNYRTNGALVQSFEMDSLNQLTTLGRSGSYTVAGTTWSLATNVTVSDNGNAAVAALRYTDATFARTNVTLMDGTNTFTAFAQDSYGRTDSNTVTAYLPTSGSFVYDGNGNLLTDGRRHFSYDDENQLVTAVVTNSTRSEFTYDGKMRRRVRKEFAWSSGSWILTSECRYVYDGKLVIQERNAMNIPQVTYTRGRDLSGSLQGAGGIGGLLARSEMSNLQSGSGNAHAFYHADGNGNITCLINANQQIVARYLYDPYGNTIAATGPIAEANLYRFSSKELHLASGMVYYLYRFYAPDAQRWINRDPVHEWGFHLVATHTRVTKASLADMYRFCGNNPISNHDAVGLKPGCDLFPDASETPCVLEACARHDACWARYDCDAGSWFPTSLACTRCGWCNLQVVADIAACALVDGGF